MNRLLTSLIVLCAVSLTGADLTAQWTQTQGPAGGTVSTLLGHGSTVFAGTLEGGVFRTTNGGQTWQPCNTGLGTRNAAFLARLNSTLFLGSTEGGLYRSTDDGDTWTNVNQPKYSLDMLGLAVVGQSLFAVTCVDLHKSDDGGSTSKIITSDLPIRCGTVIGSAGTTLCVLANHDAFVLSDGAQTWDKITPHDQVVNACLASDGSTLLVAGRSEIWRSTHIGGSWTTLHSVPTGFTPNVIGVHGQHAFIGCEGFPGLFRSTDAGNTWLFEEAVNDTNERPVVTSLLIHDSIVYAGIAGGAVNTSSDYGVSWTTTTQGLASSTVHRMVRSGANVIAGTDAGISLSSDGGTNWTRVAGDTLLRGVVDIGQTSDATYVLLTPYDYTNSEHSNLYRTTDDGVTWTTVTVTPNDHVLSLGTRGDTLFITGSKHRMQRSTDAGVTWETLGSGPIAVVRDYYFTDSIYYAATYDGLYVSGDNGHTWNKRGNGINDADMLAILLKDSILYVGTRFDGVYYSTDYGRRWTPASSTLRSGQCNDIVAIDSMIVVASSQGIWTTTDKGLSWQDENEGLYGVESRTILAVDDQLLSGTAGSGVWKRSMSDLHNETPPPPPIDSGVVELKAYPNPTASSITLSFSLPTPGNVSVAIFNAQGVHITTISSGLLASGPHSLTWNALGVPPGIYYAQTSTSESIRTIPLMLMK